MKKILAIILILSGFTSACKKEFEQPADWTSVLIIQASPTATTSPTDTLNVMIDKQKYNSASLTYNTNSTYLPVLAGNHSIDIQRIGINGTANYLSAFNYTFEKGQAYSFIAYDTTTSNTGVAKMLSFKDDLTLPTGANAKARFYNLAPNAGAFDLTFIRGTYFDTSTATGVTKFYFVPVDSVTISNKAYIGANPGAVTSDFTVIPAVTGAVPSRVTTLAAVPDYNKLNRATIKLKDAGTQNVRFQNLIVTTPTVGKIYTYYTTGTAKNRPLVFSSFTNY